MSLLSIDISKQKKRGLKLNLPEPEQVNVEAITEVKRPPSEEDIKYSQLLKKNPALDKLVVTFGLVNGLTGERLVKVTPEEITSENSGKLEQNKKIAAGDQKKLVALVNKIMKAETFYTKEELVNNLQEYLAGSTPLNNIENMSKHNNTSTINKSENSMIVEARMNPEVANNFFYYKVSILKYLPGANDELEVIAEIKREKSLLKAKNKAETIFKEVLGNLKEAYSPADKQEYNPEKGVGQNVLLHFCDLSSEEPAEYVIDSSFKFLQDQTDDNREFEKEVFSLLNLPYPDNMKVIVLLQREDGRLHEVLATDTQKKAAVNILSSPDTGKIRVSSEEFQLK